MPRAHPDPIAQREQILAEASRLLQEEGPAALRNRTIAERAGCTTMALYSRFGGKHGVLDALVSETLSVLGEALQTIDGGLPPARQIIAACLALRSVASDRPGHYALLMSRPVPGYSPPVDSRQRLLEVLEPLRAALEAARDDGEIAGDLDDLLDQLLMLCNGHIIARETPLSSGEGDAERRYRDALEIFLRGVQDGA